MPYTVLMFLSLVALQAGGYSHPWSSAYVLCTLLIGLACIIGFIVYEWKFARYPMIPHEMFSGQKIVGMAYGIAFVAGKPRIPDFAYTSNIVQA